MPQDSQATHHPLVIFPVDSVYAVDSVNWVLPSDSQWVNALPTTPKKSLLAPLETEATGQLTPKPAIPGFDWAIGIILLILLIMAFIQKAFRSKVSELINAFTSNRFVRQLLREESVMTNRTTISLLLVFLMSFSLFVAIASDYGGYLPEQLSGINAFLIVTGLSLGYLLFKSIFLAVTGSLLEIEAELQEYRFNVVLFNIMLGLLMLPLVVGLLFLGGKGLLTPTKIALIWTGIILTSTLFTSRLIKLFYLGVVSTNFSRFYIILYICTLEILPLLVIFKYLGLEKLEI